MTMMAIQHFHHKICKYMTLELSKR